MFEQNKLAVAIMNGEFEKADSLLQSGETLTGNFVQNNKSQIFNSIIRAKATRYIVVLENNGLLQTDIYEYENFDRSIFKNISQQLGNDDDSLHFMKTLMQKMENINDEVGDQTLLGFCLDEGADPAIIQCLIDEGCDVNYKNNAERNLLFLVIGKNMLPGQKGLAYLNILISQGVDVNEKDIAGNTPLLAAIQSHKSAYLDLLLQNGADPNEQNKQGNTAFYYAVTQCDEEMLNTLCEYATPNLDPANRYGLTLMPEFIRLISGSEPELRILGKLVEAGADFTQTSLYYGEPKSGTDWLAEKKANILEYVLALNCIDVNRQDDKGNTLLHKACGYNINFDKEAAKETYKKVKLLLEAGALKDVSNDKNETPIMLAQQDNLKVKTVELLMR